MNTCLPDSTFNAFEVALMIEMICLVVSPGPLPRAFNSSSMMVFVFGSFNTISLGLLMSEVILS